MPNVLMRVALRRYGDKSDHNIDAEFEADLDDELKSRVVKRRYDFVVCHAFPPLGQL